MRQAHYRRNKPMHWSILLILCKKRSFLFGPGLPMFQQSRQREAEPFWCSDPHILMGFVLAIVVLIQSTP
jgi:hypothetical protein